MFGKGVKYSVFECERFDLPNRVLLSECQITNERHFIEFLIRNDWVQRMVGIKMPTTNGLFPDIKGEIYDGSGDRIQVEVEYRAENYVSHGHSYRGCDLILSFLKSPEVRMIKGIPVWSFYEAYKSDKWGVLTLFSDIKYDFADHFDEDELTEDERVVFNKFGRKGLAKHRKSSSVSKSKRQYDSEDE